MAEVVEGKRKVLVDGLDVKHKYSVKKTSQDSSMGNPAVQVVVCYLWKGANPSVTGGELECG